MQEKIILIGGGGHCKSVIDVIEQENRYEILGIIDVKEKIGAKVLGYAVIGCDDDIEELSKSTNNFFITFGQGKNNTFRKQTYSKLKSLNLKLPVIKSPLSHVSKHSAIGEGTIVMHWAIVNAGAKVGVNCILNTQSLIEHDVEIGDHCHISTKVTLNGTVKLGSSVFAGSSCVIADGLSICENVTIGAGSTVIKSIVEEGVYVGCPAKKVV
jgi:sugar O-acyltransferase (sialic acid O-acetyltransferase NeuD family)